ncbi:PQQ-dependent sugar dehydrogenase [Streptomyces corynorhini]|uniref:PQQ-dependent sugar dehydrogenase n=1 Tax=Streptomyces corynorhini TaxID=2282652 RepID=A0A370BAE0_9ACTN|nr:PQQ-dependent sugar dehydrogenase [Streptomyces corynorhini]RDG37612.1 PQQ-dependent sugar dehydrogenase [Streptomyces corynorhini]
MTAVCAAVALVVATGCSSDRAPDLGRSPASSPAGTPSQDASPSPSAAPAKGSVKVVSTLTRGLRTPWGLAALPDGDLLVSSRDDGTITRVGVRDGERGKKTAVGSVPGVAPGGEGGLLGIALSPTYASDRLVYAYFTTASDNRVARMLYDEKKPAGQQLSAPDTVLRGIPKGTIHNGGRIAFGPDKMLYAGTGEAGDPALAQDKESLGGKILRMTPDGQPVHGNPEADSVVYSLGHRDVQGLAWDARGQLWASEFGQDTWDELNLIEPGKNYGWPDVEGEGGTADGFVDPVEVWPPSEASPSGLAFAEGSLWMAALRGQRLWRVPLAGRESAAPPQAFLKGEYGRLRTVLATGGGTVWLTTSATDGRGTPRSGDDRILRLEVG